MSWVTTLNCEEEEEEEEREKENQEEEEESCEPTSSSTYDN